MRKNGMYYSELFHRMLDDILTDSVIVMLEKRFPYDTGFMPWAYTILHYTTLKNIRAKFRLQNAPECSLEDFSPDSIYLKCNKSSDFAEQFAANAWFFWAIKTLTDKRKKVLYLRYVLNYSFNDIAQAMDKSENSVIQLHYQAIRQLRKWYE
jgi:RNA polymerase sigma factor (sigma-70 family)